MDNNLSDFYNGDSINFTFSDPNNYPTAEYDCEILFTNNDGNFRYTTTKENNSFKLNIIDTTEITAGRYKVYAIFSKTDFKRTEFINFINIKQQISDATNEDIISYNQKMLTAIEDLLFKRTESDYSSYTIGNRSIVKMTPDSLLKWRNYFKDLVEKEEMIKNGKKNYIKIRWVGRFGE